MILRLSKSFLFSNLNLKGSDAEFIGGTSFYLIHRKNLGRTCKMKEEGDLFQGAPEGRLGPAKASYRPAHLDSTRARYFWSFELPGTQLLLTGTVLCIWIDGQRGPLIYCRLFQKESTHKMGDHASQAPTVPSQEPWDYLMCCWQRVLRNGRTQSLFRRLDKEWGWYFYNTAFAMLVSPSFSSWFHLLYYGKTTDCFWK